MEAFQAADALLREQLGKDVIIALATRTEDGVSVRNVDGYYRDGCVYVMTYAASHKMREIEENSAVALCKDLMCAQGTGENLGSPKAPENRALRDELKAVFRAFYDRHVNEDDPLTCILRITLTSAVVFGSDTKYIVDFAAKTARTYPFVNDIIIP